MIEDIIVQLDGLGVSYEEDGAGGLSVDVASIDKVTLIEVIRIAQDSGLEFTIDENTLMIIGGEPMDMGEEMPMEEPVGEEDFQAAALEEMF